MPDELMTEPAFLGQLTDALRQRFPGAKIDFERIRADRFRFIVVWDQFEPMGHPERQKLVWDIADERLNKDQLWNVGMIITVAPSEIDLAD